MLCCGLLRLNITISSVFVHADSTAITQAISLPWTDGFYEARETVGLSSLFKYSPYRAIQADYSVEYVLLLVMFDIED
jgi:hypothetical protein